MKKVLAVLLSLAMLLPGMSVLMSAKQVVTAEIGTDKYAYAPDGAIGGAGMSVPSKIVLDVMLPSDGEREPLIKDTWSLDSIYVAADGLGVCNKGNIDKIDYELKKDTWYTVKFDWQSGSKTEILVNGEKVGEVNTVLGKMVFLYMQNICVDNVWANRTKDDDNSFDKEDFEDGKWSLHNEQLCSGKDGLDENIRDKQPVTYHNNNVYQVEGNNKIVQYNSENKGVNFAIDNVSNQKEYTVKFRLRFDKEDSFLKANTGYGLHGPYIDFNGDVGVDNTHVNRGSEFETGKWYEFTYYTNGEGSVVQIDGVALGENGTVAAGLPENAMFHCHAQNISIDDVRVYSGNAIANADASEQWSEDFQDGEFQHKQDDFNGAIVNDLEDVKRDLGKKYMTSASSKHFHTTFDSVFSFDICLSKDDSNIIATGDNSPLIALDKVGAKVNGAETTFPYTFTKGVWYFVEYVVGGGKTTVNVDGKKVGEIDSEMSNNSEPQRSICFNAYNEVYFDNFRGTGPSWGADMVENFEDGEWNLRDRDNSLHDGGETITTNDYELRVGDPLDSIETKEVGGDAVLLQQAPSESRKAHSAIVPEGNFVTGGEKEGYILNFDLALIPNLKSDNEDEGNYFEIRNIDRDINGTDVYNDWRIGVKPTASGLKGYVGQHQLYDYNGIKEDYKADATFEWGDKVDETTFHNVTVVANFNTGKMMIYIDRSDDNKEPILTGAIGAKGAETVLFGLYNTNAIIDNMQMFNLDGKALSTGVEFPATSAGSGNVDSTFEYIASTAGAINLDIPEDSTFCDVNGHVAGVASRPEGLTCHKNVYDVANCALCDATEEGGLFKRELPKIAHKWSKINMSSKETVDGKDLIAFKCDRADDGCTEKRYTTYPATGTYTGALHEYYDMSNELVILADNGLNTQAFKLENGLLRYGKGTGTADTESKKMSYLSYSPADPVRANSWTWSMDIIYNGIYNTDDTEDSKRDDGTTNYGYGHVLYFNTDATLQKGLVIGYNADEHKVYISTKNGNTADPFPNANGNVAVTADFTMLEGNKYNIKVSSYIDKNNDFGGSYLTLSINGKELLKVQGPNVDGEENMSEDDLIEGIYSHLDSEKYTNTLSPLVLRPFGFDFDMVNLALGDVDFDYSDRVYDGDVDGDNKLEAADVLLLRQYLATIKKDKDIQVARADVNGDGRVNAKDQLCIRIALAEQAAAN